MSTIENIAARARFQCRRRPRRPTRAAGRRFQPGPVQPPGTGRHGPVDERRHDDDRRHVQQGLKWRVGALLTDLSQHREPCSRHLRRRAADLGSASRPTGGRTNSAPCPVPAARTTWPTPGSPMLGKLLVKLSGDVFSFDTGNLSIYGVQQQQGGGIGSVVLNTSNGPMSCSASTAPDDASGLAIAPPAGQRLLAGRARSSTKRKPMARARASTASKSRMPRFGSSAQGWRRRRRCWRW